MAIVKVYHGMVPSIHPSAFVAENAVVVAEVVLEQDCSVWFGAVLRGDVGAIQIGAGSNIQDLCMVHCTSNHSKTIVGEYVTVGHGAILHGCIVEDECLIGMGAIVMDNARIKSGTIVAAGSVVLENQVLDGGYLYGGAPARQLKPLSVEQTVSIRKNAIHYITLQKEYRHGCE